MVFQFYSHSHLYEDTVAGTHSRKYSKKSPKRNTMNEKEPVGPVPQPATLTGESEVLAPPPRRPQSPSSFPRSLSSAPDLSGGHSLGELPPQNTVRLVPPSPRGSPTLGPPMDRTGSAASDRSDVTLTEGQGRGPQNPSGQQATPEVTNDEPADTPQLSWVMTVSILTVVSVVRTQLVSHWGSRFNRYPCSWLPSLPTGWW